MLFAVLTYVFLASSVYFLKNIVQLSMYYYAGITPTLCQNYLYLILELLQHMLELP